MKPLIPLVFILLTTGALPSRLHAQPAERPADIVIEVDGLACPFCTFGIEKKLRKIEGVSELAFSIEEGRIDVWLEDGARVSETEIRKAIADAGFEVRSITFVNEKARATDEKRDTYR